MSRRPVAALALFIPLALSAIPLHAGQSQPITKSTPAGSGLFSTYCAVCHGTDAKGTGPLASSMRVRPADLTAIAKANGGTFPKEQVARIIDGRNPVKGHGGGDMPVWGDAFGQSRDAGPENVTERIDALVAYIQTLQVK